MTDRVPDIAGLRAGVQAAERSLGGPGGVARRWAESLREAPVGLELLWDAPALPAADLSDLLDPLGGSALAAVPPDVFAPEGPSEDGPRSAEVPPEAAEGTDRNDESGPGRTPPATGRPSGSGLDLAPRPGRTPEPFLAAPAPSPAAQRPGPGPAKRREVPGQPGRSVPAGAAPFASARMVSRVKGAQPAGPDDPAPREERSDYIQQGRLPAQRIPAIPQQAAGSWRAAVADASGPAHHPLLVRLAALEGHGDVDRRIRPDAETGPPELRIDDAATRRPPDHGPSPGGSPGRREPDLPDRRPERRMVRIDEALRAADPAAVGPAGGDGGPLLARMVRLLEELAGGLETLSARLEEAREWGSGPGRSEPSVRWLEEDELAGRLQRILARQARSRGIDLS